MNSRRWDEASPLGTHCCIPKQTFSVQEDLIEAARDIFRYMTPQMSLTAVKVCKRDVLFAYGCAGGLDEWMCRIRMMVWEQIIDHRVGGVG